MPQVGVFWSWAAVTPQSVWPLPDKLQLGDAETVEPAL